MLFRGINGLYACTNPNCTNHQSYNGVTIGSVFTKDMNFCPDCGSSVYELINDRRCGALYLKGFIARTSGREYLWRDSGPYGDDDMHEIHYSMHGYLIVLMDDRALGHIINEVTNERFARH